MTRQCIQCSMPLAAGATFCIRCGSPNPDLPGQPPQQQWSQQQQWSPQQQQWSPQQPPTPWAVQQPASPYPPADPTLLATHRPSPPPPPPSSALPGIALTIVVTALVGVFGAIVAALHAGRAQSIGQSGARYWKAFLFTLLAQLVVFGVVMAITYGSLLPTKTTTTSVAVPMGATSQPVPSRTVAASAPAAPATTVVAVPSPGTVTVTATAVAPPPAPVAFPATSKPCTPTLSVNANTSCEFAMNVAAEYARYGGGGTVVLRQVYSPATRMSYDMSCTRNDYVTCVGGNDAGVYFRP